MAYGQFSSTSLSIPPKERVPSRVWQYHHHCESIPCFFLCPGRAPPLHKQTQFHYLLVIRIAFIPQSCFITVHWVRSPTTQRVSPPVRSVTHDTLATVHEYLPESTTPDRHICVQREHMHSSEFMCWISLYISLSLCKRREFQQTKEWQHNNNVDGLRDDDV